MYSIVIIDIFKSVAFQEVNLLDEQDFILL